MKTNLSKPRVIVAGAIKTKREFVKDLQKAKISTAQLMDRILSGTVSNADWGDAFDAVDDLEGYCDSCLQKIKNAFDYWEQGEEGSAAYECRLVLKQLSSMKFVEVSFITETPPGGCSPIFTRK